MSEVPMKKTAEERAEIYKAEAMRLAVECDRLHTWAINLRTEVERLERVVATLRPPAPAPRSITIAEMLDEPWFDSPDAGRGMTPEQQRRAGLRDG